MVNEGNETRGGVGGDEIIAIAVGFWGRISWEAGGAYFAF